MSEELKSEYREEPHGQLYLERVEAAAMQVLTQAIIDKDWPSADHSIAIMERLSIV